VFLLLEKYHDTEYLFAHKASLSEEVYTTTSAEQLGRVVSPAARQSSVCGKQEPNHLPVLPVKKYTLPQLALPMAGIVLRDEWIVKQNRAGNKNSIGLSGRSSFRKN
jgi:hypothetical protein